MPKTTRPCDIIILGASGDLSRRKLLPALFSLYCNDLLPASCRIFGYARTKMNDEQFRDRLRSNLTCRYDPFKDRARDCSMQMETFLSQCFYVAGAYDDDADFSRLHDRLQTTSAQPADRVVYMAVPPSVFLTAAQGIAGSGLAAQHDERWARVVLEKPFGHDSDSSQQLTDALAGLFDDEQLYRIDHYLGKEVIQNLLVLRFANTILQPIWNRDYIKHVEITFAEKIGCEGRAGYFDSSGIIRDVIQNHLLQILALIAMEPPVAMTADEIAEEKAKVLRAVQPPTLQDTVLGQYVAGDHGPAYRDDPDVPDDSRTETYAEIALQLHNARWEGVPFVLRAGKALNAQETTICLKFRPPPHRLFPATPEHCDNDLHIRVQPDEAIELHLANRVPGFDNQVQMSKLDMLYHQAFDQVLPDAYERLLLDVIRGDRRLFIQPRELDASWRVVTPLLQAMAEHGVQPKPYAFGSAGPDRNAQPQDHA